MVEKELNYINALRIVSQGIFLCQKSNFYGRRRNYMANTNIKGIWLPIDILINSELNDKEKISNEKINIHFGRFIFYL